MEDTIPAELDKIKTKINQIIARQNALEQSSNQAGDHYDIGQNDTYLDWR